MDAADSTIPAETIERFNSAVDRSGGPLACWPWTKGRNLDGYGQIRVRGVQTGAHRLAFVLARGSIAGGMSVLHTCDNRRCCNPAHLYAGTHRDNMIDMVARGRGRPPVGSRHPSRTHPERLARGERNGAARITEAIVRDIRRRYMPGRRPSQRELAQEYGIAQTLVGMIARGELWAHVSPDAATRAREGLLTDRTIKEDAHA